MLSDALQSPCCVNVVSLLVWTCILNTSVWCPNHKCTSSWISELWFYTCGGTSLLPATKDITVPHFLLYSVVIFTAPQFKGEGALELQIQSGLSANRAHKVLLTIHISVNFKSLCILPTQQNWVTVWFFLLETSPRYEIPLKVTAGCDFERPRCVNLIPLAVSAPYPELSRLALQQWKCSSPWVCSLSHTVSVDPPSFPGFSWRIPAWD